MPPALRAAERRAAAGWGAIEACLRHVRIVRAGGPGQAVSSETAGACDEIRDCLPGRRLERWPRRLHCDAPPGRHPCAGRRGAHRCRRRCGHAVSRRGSRRAPAGPDHDRTRRRIAPQGLAAAAASGGRRSPAGPGRRRGHFCNGRRACALSAQIACAALTRACRRRRRYRGRRSSLHRSRGSRRARSPRARAARAAATVRRSSPHRR